MIIPYMSSNLIAFIQNKMKHGRSYKGRIYYSAICTLFSINQTLAEKLILSIPTTTYFKDYFYILRRCKNPELEAFIYSTIINQLNSDLDNLAHNRPISNLAKWMPRENKYFDRKLNFVSKFCELYFGKGKKFALCAKYRKLVTRLNKVINPIEISMCAKKISDRDLNNLTNTNIQLYDAALKKTELSFYDKVKQRKFEDMDVGILLDRLLFLIEIPERKQKYASNVSLMEKIWANKKFELPVLANKTILIDIDSDTYSKMKKSIFKIVLTSIKNSNKVFINGPEPYLMKSNDCVSNIVDEFVSHIVTCKKIELDKLRENNDAILVISNKTVSLGKNDVLLKLTDSELTEKNKANYYGNPFYRVVEKHVIIDKMFSGYGENKSISKFIVSIMLFLCFTMSYRLCFS